MSASGAESLVDNMSDLVARFLPDGTMLWVNRAYSETVGVPREQIIGNKYAMVVHPDDLARVQAAVASLRPENREVVIENRILVPSGEQRWLEWTNRGFFDAEGRLIECQATGRDVTDRVETQRALDRERERFRFLADASAILSLSLDLEGTLARVTRLCVPYLADSCVAILADDHGQFRRISTAHVDPAIERLLEQRPEYLEPHRFSPKLQELVARVVSGDPVLVPELSESELRALELDPEDQRLATLQKVRSFMVVPLAARDRTLGALTLSSSRSYSNRSYGERDLELAREIGRRAAIAVDNARLHRELQSADQAKDEFLATLAHELRNPMAAILNALSVLEQPRASEAARQRAIAVASRQVRQQARLVDDLLDVSRLVRGRVSLRRRRLELSALLRQIADAHLGLFEARLQQLVVELSDEPLWVDADEARFEQIVGNLLDNAAKFSPVGGRVVLWSERRDASARVGVRDEGTGIPSDLRSHVFDLFAHGPRGHDTPSSGLGLGLTVVRGLVELHGGRVEVFSGGAGQGSEFVVTLPLATPDVAAASEAPASGPRASAPSRVLVVDDNVDAADMLVELLDSWGCSAQAVYDGPSALDAAPKLDPDLILVDIGMPRMDGYETARRLRELPGGDGYRLVALTGYAQPQDVEAARRAGFDRHVAKPIDTETLRSLLPPAQPPSVPA